MDTSLNEVIMPLRARGKPEDLSELFGWILMGS